LDGDIEQEGWHANFTPNVAGGRLLFSAPNLTILDQVIYPAQMTDVSYGRFPNGTGAFMQLVPTFGTENQENPPPVIHSMSQLPNTINAEKICTVEAEISDNNGWTTDTANLNVSINNGPPDVFEMTDPNHDGVFTAQFDLADYRVTLGDQVSYWIEAQDDAGALGSNIDDQLSFNIIELMNPEAEILVVSDNMEDRFNVIVTYLDDSDIEYELYDIDQNKGIDEYTVDGGAWGTIFVCGRSTLLPTREYQTCPFRNVVAEDKNFILSDMDYFAGNGENAAPVFSAGDLAYDLFGIESGVNDPVPTDSVFFGEPGDVISGNWTDQPFITYPNRYSSDQADFVVPNANGVPIFTGEEMENFQALRCDFNNRKSAYFAFDIFSNCRKDSLYNPERNEWDYWLEPTEDFNTLMNNLTAWFDVGQISYMSINLRMNYFELTSLYITPPDLAAAEVFGGINDLVIVYQDDGHIYIPPFINTIGNITITEGYQIFCSQPSSLTIVGSPVNPAIQYNLQSNRWNWLGYPFDYPIPINVALSGIADRITIAMNDGGGFWIPPFINTLGNMIPGEGYFIFVTQNLTFQYNPGIMKIAGSSNEVWDIPEAENAPPATGLPYVVLVRLTEHLKKLQPDVIELYDDHLLVGKAGVLKDYELTPVIAWGGAPDYNLAGFAVGHPMTIKVKSADKEISTVCGGQPVLFGEGAYAEVELEVDSPAIPTEFTVKSAYPNPFNPTVTIPFAVPSKGELSFTVYNVLGQQVFQQNRIFEAGYFEFLFDASLTENNLVSGIYFIQIQYNDQSNIQKVILMR